MSASGHAAGSPSPASGPTPGTPSPVRSGVLPAGWDGVALVLQGGGALGTYQAGVQEGLEEAGIAPDRIAGISIGAINAALIAGNPPARRVARLREFWETVSAQPLWPRLPLDAVAAWHAGLSPEWARALGGLHAWRALLEGQRGFFAPRPLPPVGDLADVPPTQASFYDTTPLRGTLERLVDFDRLNDGGIAVSVGAVDVETGNFRSFDNRLERLGPEHIMASGALPPGFAPVEIEGRLWWDGGLVSNTPLSTVVEERRAGNTLVFQVDLWSARGRAPRDIPEVLTRLKEVQYSSRTRAVTDRMKEEQGLRGVLGELMDRVPENERHGPAWEKACTLAADRRVTVLQLIHHSDDLDSHYKDYQFGLATMRQRWAAGLADVRATLANRDWLAVPPADDPFRTFDIRRR